MGYYADDREKISEIKNRDFYNGGKAMSETKGRVTIPTDLDVIPETLKMLDEWGQMPSVTVMEQNFRQS